MSIRDKISNYFNEVDKDTRSKDYTAEELATVAEDVLGREKIKYKNGWLIEFYGEMDAYETSDRGVKVNSKRNEVYDALSEAAEMLEEGEVEVIE